MAKIERYEAATVPVLADRVRCVLGESGLISLPTESFYGLAAAPFDEQALARLWAVKDRSEGKPGIEIGNPGQEWGYRKFPARQIDMVVALVQDIKTRHDVPASRVLGHSDVAPQRKEDPGELFPWGKLAAEGLAIGRYAGDEDPSSTFEDALAMLRAIGYDAPDKAHAAAVVAFQRRFCPKALAQGFSPLTKAALKWAVAAMA